MREKLKTFWAEYLEMVALLGYLVFNVVTLRFGNVRSAFEVEYIHEGDPRWVPPIEDKPAPCSRPQPDATASAILDFMRSTGKETKVFDRYLVTQLRKEEGNE